MHRLIPSDEEYDDQGARAQGRSFWNAGDEEARLLKLISPGRFYRYFEEMVAISEVGRPDPKLAAPIRERHQLLEVDSTSIPKLIAEHRLNT